MVQIYNTLERRKGEFQPIRDGEIRMYVCGVTTYDYCHIGHARVMVAFDAIVRYLRHRHYAVRYVRNITDIDDKILKRAEENGEAYEALTARFIDAMHEDERALGVLPPDEEPRATAHIDDIIALIQQLLDRDMAYTADHGDVYFSVTDFAGYGKLSNKKLDDLLEGVRVELETSKRDPRDFALWKGAEPDDVGWEAPWGYGRPGWHIECSAMSTGCLGNHFDIHGGGPDLVFPHHENEIAQSEAATGETYANVWMHAGAVRVDNEKMSKSLGNFFTIREVLERYWGEVIRYFLLSSHYRSPINYSEESLQRACSGLERLYNALRAYATVPAADVAADESLQGVAAFNAAMDDDFNTPEAISVLFDLARQLNQQSGVEAEVTAGVLKGLGTVLGLLQADPEVYLKSGGLVAAEGDWSDADIDALVEQRIEAKKQRDFSRADAIRDQLTEAGIVLEDGPEGTQWRRG
ncbi:MAG: cysteine--tRNA ligase [Pseudomonadota bacterium]